MDRWTDGQMDGRISEAAESHAGRQASRRQTQWELVLSPECKTRQAEPRAGLSSRVLVSRSRDKMPPSSRNPVLTLKVFHGLHEAGSHFGERSTAPKAYRLKMEAAPGKHPLSDVWTG